MDQFKNHDLKFIKMDRFAGINCKIYKCSKCNYDIYAYDDDNFLSIWFYDGNDVSKILSCEEMQIKKFLE